MTKAKEELIRQIEAAREKLNESIEKKADYARIYQYSVELDRLLNQYVVCAQ